MKRNKKLIREWIDALRSGTYLQGDRRLCLGTRYCCLGVVCEVDMKHSDSVVSRKKQQEYITCSGNGLSIYLNDEVMSHIGITPDEQGTLAKLNDKGLTFKQIADYIERNILNTEPNVVTS